MSPKFSTYENQVQLLLEAKTPISIISSTLKRPKKSIYDTIRRIKKKKEEFNTLERVRKGRIEKLSPRDKRAINRDLTRSPKKVNKRVIIENNLEITKRSLQRFLKKEGYSINKSPRKSFLTKERAIKRLKYAKEQDKNI